MFCVVSPPQPKFRSIPSKEILFSQFTRNSGGSPVGAPTARVNRVPPEKNITSMPARPRAFGRAILLQLAAICEFAESLPGNRFIQPEPLFGALAENPRADGDRTIQTDRRANLKSQFVLLYFSSGFIKQKGSSAKTRGSRYSKVVEVPAGRAPRLTGPLDQHMPTKTRRFGNFAKPGRKRAPRPREMLASKFVRG
jgi:hypothetical protein